MSDAEHHIPARGQESRVARWLPVVGSLLDMEPRTTERARAVKLAALALEVSPRTVYRAMDRYDAFGDLGLARAQPQNAGKARVVISRKTDKAIGDPELLAKLGLELDLILKGLWKSTASRMGGRKIAVLAGEELRRRSAALGAALAPGTIFVPRKRAERYAHYRIVDVWKSDRKRFSDTAPRVRRTREHLRPMEVLVADVKHFDVVVRRADGSEAYPKMIAFEDAATGRVFGHPVLLKANEGVRREHVNEAFLAMASHPRWGVCSQLLIDRGAENGGLDSLRGPLGELSRSSVNVVIRSRPYTPQSKPIEGWFGRFDKFGVSQIPGYIGPDRTRKKTQTQGRPPEPFSGTFEDFSATVTTLIGTFNTWPISGMRAGRSPEQIMAEHIDEGWRPITVDPLVLEAAFYRQDTRLIDRGGIKINGMRYTHPAIYESIGRLVEVAISWRRGEPPLFRVPGGNWLRSEVDPVFDFFDVAGAHEGDKRRRARERAVRKLDRETPSVDPLQIVMRTRPTEIASIPKDGGARLDGGSALRELAAGLRDADSPEERKAPTADARWARRLPEIQRIEKRYGPVQTGEG